MSAADSIRAREQAKRPAPPKPKKPKKAEPEAEDGAEG